jgi:hypothetical protein
MSGASEPPASASHLDADVKELLEAGKPAREIGNDSARTRELARAVEAALLEVQGAERYAQAQRDRRDGRARSEERPHPLEFDRNGFPTPQRLGSFRARVRRLISGS